MSEDKVPYRAYNEQELPLIMGKTYFYAGYVDGTIDNDFKCGLQVIEVLWTEEVDKSDLKYMRKLFGTRQEAQIFADEMNNNMVRHYTIRQEQLRLEWQERLKNIHWKSNRTIWEEMICTYLQEYEKWGNKRVTPEAEEQRRLALDRIMRANPDKMIIWLRNKGKKPQEMTREEKLETVIELINEEIEAQNPTDLS